MHDIARRVYDTDGVSPTLHTCGGGNLEPKILEPHTAAMRGRNPDNPSDRTAGIPTEQRLEIGGKVANTITTVQKDSLVVIPLDEQNHCLRMDGTVGTLTTDGSSPKHNNRIVGIAEPSILRKDQIEVGKQIRVRKLTPRECGRLMSVKDEDIDKLTKNLSKSAQYHCFGDSIVVTILCAIFGKMLVVDWKAKVEELITELSSPPRKAGRMLSTRGKDTVGALRASMHKQGERNLVENIEHGLGYEGVIEMDNPIIIDDTYGYENEPRVYKENCPTLRADRQGLKVIEGQIGATETHIKNKERTK